MSFKIKDGNTKRQEKCTEKYALYSIHASSFCFLIKTERLFTVHTSYVCERIYKVESEELKKMFIVLQLYGNLIMLIFLLISFP